MLRTPDINPAQLIAIVGAALGLLVAAGLDLSKELQDSIIQLVTVLSSVLLVSDAAIRHGRSRAFQNPPKPIDSDDEGGA